MGNITHKQYTIIILFVASSVLLLAGIVNYYVDPAKLYSRGSYEHGIVDLLQQGKNVANISNHDERLLQKYYAESLQESKEVLVLGSSRSMQIRSKLFEPDTFFNASVSGSSIEDYLSIFSIYHQNDQVPGKLVLGIDPWVFNSNKNQTRWRAVRKNYNDMLEIMYSGNINKGDEVEFDKLKQLISWGYLVESISVMFKQNKKPLMKDRGYYPISEDFADVSVKRPDGSRYEAFYESRSSQEVDESVRKFVISPYSLQDFNEIDVKAAHHLEVFIEFLLGNNVEIVIFLAPYHPYIYDQLIKKDSLYIVKEVEEYLRRMSNKYQVSLIGSYSPYINNCNANEFYDGMHPKEVCVNRIFRSSL